MHVRFTHVSWCGAHSGFWVLVIISAFYICEVKFYCSLDLRSITWSHLTGYFLKLQENRWMKSCFIVRHWKYYWITFMCFLKSKLNDLKFYLKFYLSLNKRQSSKQTNLQWLNIASWLCLGAECVYCLGRGIGSFWVPKRPAVISSYLGCVCL